MPKNKKVTVESFIEKLGKYFDPKRDMRFMHALRAMIRKNPKSKNELKEIAKTCQINTETHLKTKKGGKYDRQNSE